MFNLYDTVKPKRDFPKLHLKSEHIGCIVDILGNGKAYTVEFFDEEGNTIEDALFYDFEEQDLIKIATNK